MPTIYKHAAPTTKSEPLKHDSFYDSTRWRRLGKVYKAEHPLCQYCLEDGYYVPGFILDHYYCRRLFPELEWDTAYMMNACRTCDQTKRQLEANCYDREVLKQKLVDNGFILKGGGRVGSLASHTP